MGRTDTSSHLLSSALSPSFPILPLHLPTLYNTSSFCPYPHPKNTLFLLPGIDGTGVEEQGKPHDSLHGGTDWNSSLLSHLTIPLTSGLFDEIHLDLKHSSPSPSHPSLLALTTTLTLIHSSHALAPTPTCLPYLYHLWLPYIPGFIQTHASPHIHTHT